MKKHSLIVGGTQALGAALVERFAKENHRVSVLGRRLPRGRSTPRNVSYWPVDVRETERLSVITSEILKKGGPLSNLVFFQRYRGDGDDWSGEIGVTLTATKALIDRFTKHFVAREGGSIVLVSSLAARFVAREQPLSYHVAKAGLNQLATFYAVALGPRRIRVNGVSPGTILKDDSRISARSKHRLLSLYKKIVPLGRPCTPADVADVIAYLCSPQASFMTGQNIVVDGGLSLLLQDSLARGLQAGRL